MNDQARHQNPYGVAAYERIQAFRALSDDPHCLTRLYLSPAHAKAIDLIQSMMKEVGCDDVTVDDLGTVTGRYGGTETNSKSLLIGSHIDTVVDAGAYDGTLGIVAGLGVIAFLKENQIRYPFTIEIIAFGDEENVRFPSNLSSSRALAGTFDPLILEARDANGTSLKEALIHFNLKPEAIPSMKRDPETILGYLEVHIEQGPVLQHENLPLGIVTSINGSSRRGVTLKGVAGHAGTVPMALRKDPLAGFVEMANGLEAIAGRYADTVATIGRVEVHPNAINVIPGQVFFTLDMRGPDDADRERLVDVIEAHCLAVAKKRGLDIQIDPYYDAPACLCNLSLQSFMEKAMQSHNLPVFYLPSGAGHDAMAMADLCPVAMLFVRCKDGISHNPAEYCSVEDMESAISVLIKTVQTMALKNHIETREESR
mgnify:CR=1 FL=1